MLQYTWSDTIRRFFNPASRPGKRRERGRPVLEILEQRNLLSLMPALVESVGTTPQAVVIGDFDNNGTADLVTANGGFGGLSVLLGNGDGTYQPALRGASGFANLDAAAGDVNLDGWLDLVTGNLGGSVNVQFGNGDGTFQSPLSYPSEGGARALQLGDVNLDGWLDIVSVGNDVSVLLNNGDGTYGAAGLYATGISANSLTLADVNNDYWPDVVAVGWGGVSLLFNTGGAFSEPTVIPGPAFGPPTTVASADFNLDGWADVAVATFVSGNVSILLGDGFGNFTVAASYDTGLSVTHVEVGDFYPDGLPDVAVGPFAGRTVSVLLGNGDGSLQTARPFDAGGDSSPIAVGDVNGDGLVDLVAAHSWFLTSVGILLNDGDWTSESGAAPAGFGGFGADLTRALAPVEKTVSVNALALEASSPRSQVASNGSITAMAKETTDVVDLGARGTGKETKGDEKSRLVDFRLEESVWADAL